MNQNLIWIVEINKKMAGEMYKGIINNNLNADSGDNLPPARVIKSRLESNCTHLHDLN